MAHDLSYFRRRVAEARSAACRKGEGESVEVAGYLALAYAALARRAGARARPKASEPLDPADASVPDPVPLMLRD